MTKIILTVVAYTVTCLMIVGFCQLMASGWPFDSPKDSHGVPCTISQEYECR
jgi:hypothetical protein